MRLFNAKEVDAHLAKIQEHKAALETALATVVTGFTPAAFIWGESGHGKSYMIRSVLDGLVGGEYKHHTAYSTHKGLFLSLAEHPEKLHLFEDCESVLKVQATADTLRAACGAPNGAERVITYETQNSRFRVKLTGGIIIVTNSNLSKLTGPMQAVASRFRPTHFKLTTEQIIATIQSIARGSWTSHGYTIKANECLLVASTLIDMLGEEDTAIPLDIRLYTEHALPTYIYCQTTGQTNWADVLRSKLLGRATTIAEGQQQRTSRLQSLALAIAQDGTLKPKDRVKRWKELTNLGQAIYYRHLKAARA